MKQQVVWTDENADVQVVMVQGKRPRYEVRRGDVAVETIAATRSWRKDQAAAIEQAVALTRKKMSSAVLQYREKVAAGEAVEAVHFLLDHNCEELCSMSDHELINEGLAHYAHEDEDLLWLSDMVDAPENVVLEGWQRDSLVYFMETTYEHLSEGMLEADAHDTLMLM